MAQEGNKGEGKEKGGKKKKFADLYPYCLVVHYDAGDI